MIAQLRTLLPLAYLSIVFAAPSPRSAPSVQLDSGTFIGTTSLDGQTHKFLGIPFAKPPTGDLRFQLPVASDPYSGTHDATSIGLSCPQQTITFDLSNPLLSAVVNEVVDEVYGAVFPSGEDCLTLNIWTPSNVAPGKKLPVVVWIFGGGFEIGSPAQYDGSFVVNESLDMGSPVIYVSINYRVSAFGFLGGAEVKAAGVGNLGLQDQRLALRWVQKYISKFNGDPSKVTIWGESAGAISVALHMVANNGDNEGLFRGAFMQSGSPVPVGDITAGQSQYDALVAQTGCTGASDTLQCLREVDYDTLLAATDNSASIAGPTSLHIPWLPGADGVFLTDNPQNLVKNGYVANVPFVNGDNDDEGTLFALSLLNILTDEDCEDYIHSNYIPGATSSQMTKLLQQYPSDITEGSPFDTGILNAITPQFKRLAAIQGDLVFQAPRRYFVQQRASKQNVWSFLNTRLKATPLLGSFHGSDLLLTYGGQDMAQYLINFVNNLNPNGGGLPTWPTYSTSHPSLMTFSDDILEPLSITQDNFRSSAISYLTQLSFLYPI